MNLTPKQTQAIFDFLDQNSPTVSAYLVKMAHLERTDKMLASDFETATLIKKTFSDIKDLHDGENPMLETSIDECIHNARLHFGLIELAPVKLTLKDKFINLFKPNKGFI